jgi:hypothetical protein
MTYEDYLAYFVRPKEFEREMKDIKHCLSTNNFQLLKDKYHFTQEQISLLNQAIKNQDALNAAQQNQDALNVAQHNQEAVPKKVTVQSPSIESMIKDYKERYGKELWYKTPETKDGKTVLMLPDAKALTDFTKMQAEQNRAFTVIDGATQKVMGYSNGDGQLRHPNGDLLKASDVLRPSEMDINQFQASLNQPTNNPEANTSLPLSRLPNTPQQLGVNDLGPIWRNNEQHEGNNNEYPDNNHEFSI